MMLITIGESLKNLDKITDHTLFSVCKERLPGMVTALKAMLKEVEG